MRQFFTLILSFLSLSVFSQSIIDKIFTSLTPDNSMNFYVVNKKIYGLDATNGICIKYDKLWNELESHDAHQESITYKYSASASMGFEYSSEKQQYVTTKWGEDRELYQTNNKYGFSWSNFTEFYQGDEDKLFYTKTTNKPFLSEHTVYRFDDYYRGLDGKVRSTSSYYRLLVTDFEFINWDGELVQKIILPYYLYGGYAQYVNVEDKSYIVIGASKIYPKSIIEDIDLHSDEEYDIESMAIEPEFFHHLVYEYNRTTNSIDYIKSYKTPNDGRNLIGIFDANGIKLDTPKNGVNIYLYSDGTSQKIIK